LPKPTKGPRLGAGPAHQRLMLASLAGALFREERIQTTQAKAKRLRPVAERLITLGKRGDVNSRRQALRVIEDRDIVHKLFAEIAPRYSERNGGYTRILKLGPRHGDAAPMVLIELVEGEIVSEAPAEEKRPRRLRRRRRQPKETEEPQDEALPAEGAQEFEEEPQEPEEEPQEPEEVIEETSGEAEPAPEETSGEVEPAPEETSEEPPADPPDEGPERPESTEGKT
jgi:large subunit ribosomal protein L17